MLKKIFILVSFNFRLITIVNEMLKRFYVFEGRKAQNLLKFEIFNVSEKKNECGKKFYEKFVDTYLVAFYELY